MNPTGVLLNVTLSSPNSLFLTTDPSLFSFLFVCHMPHAINLSAPVLTQTLLQGYTNTSTSSTVRLKGHCPWKTAKMGDWFGGL